METRPHGGDGDLQDLGDVVVRHLLHVPQDENEPVGRWQLGDRLLEEALLLASASLLVDDIGDVVDSTSAAYAVIPPTLRGRARDLLLGVYKLQGEVLLVLAIGTVLRAAFAESPLPLGRS